MENKNKFIKSFVIFLILIMLTFYILFKNQDMSSIMRIIKNVDIKYIILAVFVLFGYLSCEALNLRRNLRSLNQNTNFLKCIKYTLVNAFFCGITPSSTGGQPMEVYYMHKDGIEIPSATLTVLIQSVRISNSYINVFFN